VPMRDVADMFAFLFRGRAQMIPFHRTCLLKPGPTRLLTPASQSIKPDDSNQRQYAQDADAGAFGRLLLSKPPVLTAENPSESRRTDAGANHDRRLARKRFHRVIKRSAC
jgi:hypothetical protein